jgi:ribosomal protein L11 methyltransferase
MMDYTVNWDEQWANFAENFYDGKAHINLSKFGVSKTLVLLPGPGFGDLSHPTTALMLKLMKGRVKDQNILDIGCGSGILTLAALYLEAKSAAGIDIEPEAIEHARKNLELNQLQAEFSLSTPTKRYDIALMNMIYPEQQTVMKQPIQADLWITSGILTTQRDLYHQLAQSWGWKILKEARKGDWMAFICSKV